MSTPIPAELRPAILAGCFVALVSFGFASTFGVFLRPMSESLGWSREVFSLSIALQLLCWGFTQPFAGMVADKKGAARVLGFGAVMAALGFWLRGAVIDPTVFVAAGVLVGIGTGACSFPVVIVALGKIVPADRRSFVMGLGTASASLGMLGTAMITPLMIGWIGWQNGIYVIAASFLLVLPALFAIARVSVPTAAAKADGGVGHAIRVAWSDKSYVLLFVGFFVCGFHVAFIGTHLPAYLTDQGLAPLVGGASLALIGLFNIAGSLISGWYGQVSSKKVGLSAIYLARAVVIAAFVLVPLSPWSVYVFSALMGLLWLSTIPLTTGLVAQTQGLRYLSTLVGLVFLGHQLGSFTGAWLGGRIFDQYHSYIPMWWAAVVFGLLAALIHLPIRETPGPLAREDAPV